MKLSAIRLIFYIFLLALGGWVYYENTYSGIFVSSHKKLPLFEKFRDANKTLIIAHRGSRFLLPENTILAFKTALELGADVIETDVVMTKDGELVINHDKNLDRTTEVTGEVSSYTLKEIKSFDAGYRFTPDNGTTFPYRGKGLKIPTIKELFYELPSDVQINIEIKEDSVVVAEKLWNALLDAWKNTGRKYNSVVIGSRFCAPTTKIRNMAQLYRQFYKLKTIPVYTSACEKDVTRFILLSQFYLAKLYFTWNPITSYDCLQIPTNSGAIRLDSKRVISAADYFGIHIHYWVINSQEDLNRVSDLKIGGIITDRSDRCVKVFKERGWKPKSHNVPSPLPTNSTGTYFLPVYDIDDNHTCVSFFCILMQKSDQIALSLALAYLAYRIFKRK